MPWEAPSVHKRSEKQIGTQFVVENYDSIQETLTGGTDSTTPIKFSRGDIGLQLSGVATAIAGILECSAVDPGEDGSTGVWAPVAAAISGDPSDGSMTLTLYYEPATAWYRWRNTSISGASVNVSIRGQKGA